MQRRTLLQAGLVLAATARITPVQAQSGYPLKAFLAEEVVDVMREAFGSADIGDSDKIEIDAPHIASDANMVPVRVRSGFADTESISLIVSGNKTPFSAHFRLFEGQNFVSTRVRMKQTGDLLVVVKADGALHAGRRPVRVGRGDCGS